MESDSLTEKLGREDLKWAGAIVIVPEMPLRPDSKIRCPSGGR
jgi:hypothetical protein